MSKNTVSHFAKCYQKPDNPIICGHADFEWCYDICASCEKNTMLHSKSGFNDWVSHKVVMEKTAFQTTGNLVRRFWNFKQNLSNNLYCL